MPKRGGLRGVGVLTARLPLLHRSAGSTGALPHPIPPVTPEDEENEEDEEDEEDGGGGEAIRWSQRKAISWDQTLLSEVLHF